MCNHHYELKQFKIEPHILLSFVFRVDFIYSLFVCNYNTFPELTIFSSTINSFCFVKEHHQHQTSSKSRKFRPMYQLSYRKLKM